MLAKLKIKPGEARLRTIDYTDWLQEGETITAAVLDDVSPVTVPPLSVVVDVINTTQVSLYILNGLADSEYSVSVRATTVITLPSGAVNQQRIDCIGVEITGSCTQ